MKLLHEAFGNEFYYKVCLYCIMHIIWFRGLRTSYKKIGVAHYNVLLLSLHFVVMLRGPSATASF